MAQATPASEDFARLADPFRGELLAHCYRMLGSVEDAEDQVQETMIRAWRSYGEFEGRASLRTWLYRIATNACLRALENRSRPPLPSRRAGPGRGGGPPAADELREPADPDDRALLGRYAAAFENADITTLTKLLRDDAVVEMPPLPTWFAGREVVARFFESQVLGRPGDFRMFPTAANGQPALAAYQRGRDRAHHAHAIQVFTLTGSGVARIVSFNDPGLFTMFGLPQVLPAAALPRTVLPGLPAAAL